MAESDRDRVMRYLSMLKPGRASPFFEHDGDRYMRAKMVIDTGNSMVRFTDDDGNVLYEAEIGSRIEHGVTITFEDVIFATRVNIGSSSSEPVDWDEEENPF